MLSAEGPRACVVPGLLGCLLALGVAASAAADDFVDVAAKLGIDFRHQDARSGEKYYVETAASGGGWLDFDGDGDLDLYLITGAATPGSKLQGSPHNVLYENRDGRFVDVTTRAGVGDPGYGMGMCVGDIDADGRPDFLVTNYGPDRLYRNLGDGRFEQVAEQAGGADAGWGAGCAFGDLDGDGDLDLYVARYVDFRFDRNPFCGDRARNLRSYCRPEAFDGQTDRLYLNRGAGKDGRVRFEEVGQGRGIAAGANEKGFGVLLSDFDDDGDLDIYVANDGTMNRFYRNDGRGGFEDQALFNGTGLNARGLAESGMGVDTGDADGDGRPDIVVTNYSMESNTFYRNLGGALFEDATSRSGLVEPSYKNVGWGVQLFDYDNDGDLDLAVANGHAVDNIEIFEASLAYRQPNQLFANDGKGRFREVSAEGGAVWAEARVSRALAAADFNDDGRLDLLITNTNDPVDLLENRVATSHHWLGLRLQGPAANPLAIGARVWLKAGERGQQREVRSGGSFLAQPDLRLHFGLGDYRGPVQLEIRWPDGRRQRETTEQLDRYWTIRYAPR